MEDEVSNSERENDEHSELNAQEQDHDCDDPEKLQQAMTQAQNLEKRQKKTSD